MMKRAAKESLEHKQLLKNLKKEEQSKE